MKNTLSGHELFCTKGSEKILNDPEVCNGGNEETVRDPEVGNDHKGSEETLRFDFTALKKP